MLLNSSLDAMHQSFFRSANKLQGQSMMASLRNLNSHPIDFYFTVRILKLPFFQINIGARNIVKISSLNPSCFIHWHQHRIENMREVKGNK